MEQTPLFLKLLNQLESSWEQLSDKPEESPELSLKALWLYSCGMPCAATHIDGKKLPLLSVSQIAMLENLVSKRINHEPLAYLTGRQSFLNIELLASPGVMIARKETEILGKAVLNLIKNLSVERNFIQAMDLCTGSGNLAILMAYHFPNCHVCAADLSLDAISLAKKNSQFTGLDNRIDVHSGDLFEPFELPQYTNYFDLIVCNPPYISTAQAEKLPEEIRKFEPHMAFDGGPFGIQLMTRLVREAPRFLKPSSFLCFEVGLGQGSWMVKYIQKNGGYDKVDTLLDENGEVRVIQARSTESSQIHDKR